MKNKVKDVLIRAAKTFWQAAAAYLVATFGTQLAGVDIFNAEALGNVLIGLAVGALAAGLSATWNGVIAPGLDKLKGGDLPGAGE